MRKEFILMIVGVLLVVFGSCLLVFSGTRLESSEENKKQVSTAAPIMFMGMFMSVFGIISLSARSYSFGKGKPRLLSDMLVNHIYEVIGRVSVGEGKTIAVLKEQSGKIRLTQFDVDPVATGAKFIKVIKLEKGEKAFESFPPSKETASPDETAFGQEVPEDS